MSDLQLTREQLIEFTKEQLIEIVMNVVEKNKSMAKARDEWKAKAEALHKRVAEENAAKKKAKEEASRAILKHSVFHGKVIGPGAKEVVARDAARQYVQDLVKKCEKLAVIKGIEAATKEEPLEDRKQRLTQWEADLKAESASLDKKQRFMIEAEQKEEELLRRGAALREMERKLRERCAIVESPTEESILQCGKYDKIVSEQRCKLKVGMVVELLPWIVLKDHSDWPKVVVTEIREDRVLFTATNGIRSVWPIICVVPEDTGDAWQATKRQRLE